MRKIQTKTVPFSPLIWRFSILTLGWGCIPTLKTSALPEEQLGLIAHAQIAVKAKNTFSQLRMVANCIHF